MRFVAVFSLLLALAVASQAALSGPGTASAQAVPGTITIIKNVPGTDPTFFPFSDNIPSCNIGSLADNGNPGDDTVTCPAVTATYQVTENVPDGWDLDSVSCTGVATWSEIPNGVQIELASAETAECTFENVPEPETGSITIIKNAGGANQNFNFSLTAPGVQPCEDNSFTLNDNSGATDDETFSPCALGVVYTAAESVPGGWDLTNITCSGNGDWEIGGDPDAFDAGDTFVEITLDDPDDEVTCTFTNEEEAPQDGTIIIEKDVNPEPDSTLFSFSDNIPGCSIGTLADDGAGGNPNSASCTVAAGDYTVTEANPFPYTLTGISCDDTNSEGSTVTRTASIDLSAGETVRCVFTNVPPSLGSITIIKDTNPETSGISFDFDGDLGDIDLDDDESATFTDLSSGTYVVSENEPAGWNLVDINCSGGDVTFGSNSVSIHLDAGEHITCEFVNQQLLVTATPTKTPIVPTATKTPVAPVAPVSPPSAGDGGLLDQGGVSWLFGVMSIVAAAATAWLFIQRMLRRSSRS